MNELIQKILDDDQIGVVTVLENRPELIEELSESNRTPLEVAEAMGSIYIYVTLLRNLPHIEVNEDWLDLLRGYISQISQDWLCSSWSSGIEYEIWHSLNGNQIFENHEQVYTDIEGEKKKDLDWLSNKIQGWVLYEESERVPLGEWERYYEDWKSTKIA